MHRNAPRTRGRGMDDFIPLRSFLLIAERFLGETDSNERRNSQQPFLYSLTSQLHKISELYKMSFLKFNKTKRQKETKIYLSRATFCNSNSDFSEEA